MAGPTTAERGERQKLESGPPRPPLLGRLRRLRRLIALVLALAVTAGAALWVLYGSSWLRVERVSVTGTRVLTAGQVREVADVPVGSPMASVGTDAIEARLRRGLPRIDSVDVVRSWPHAIHLNVTERKPVLLIAKDTKFTEVDRDGVRFATVSDAPKGVPRLELAVSRIESLRRFPAGRLVREAVGIAADLPPAVARDTRVVEVRSYDSVSLELTDGRTVLWGSGEKGRAKAAALTALMKADPKARHFDVSTPTAPASSAS
ncbi:cell division protein FtsQ/DivIB [Streptomyces sp. NPDC048566]|uniref:cell division protein FtsQ/DivIB n=1 Tax=Streptomyces sp. NPDC048566 TaxID=3365569 RepID=UPI00371B4494